MNMSDNLEKIMLLLRNTFFSMLVLFLTTAESSASPYKEKINKIIIEVMSIDGSLNTRIHKNFWDEIKKNGDYSEKKNLQNYFYTWGTLAQEYQKESWLSAKYSFNANNPIKTENLIRLEMKIPGEMEKVSRLIYSLSELEKQILSFNKEFNLIRNNSEKLLKAAAYRTSFKSDKGVVTPIISLELINQVLVSIDASFDRIENLFDPDWKEKPNNDDLEIYMVGYETSLHLKLSNNISTNDSVTLIIDKQFEEATFNDKKYRLIENDFSYKLISKKTGFVSSTEHRPIFLSRTTLILNASNFREYQFRVVEKKEFDKVSQDIEMKKKQEEESTIRAHEEKLRERVI